MLNKVTLKTEVNVRYAQTFVREMHQPPQQQQHTQDNHVTLLRIDVLTAMNMTDNNDLLDVMLCRLVDTTQRFGAICYFHFQEKDLRFISNTGTCLTMLKWIRSHNTTAISTYYSYTTI
jgi:hypothetical protein